MGNALFALQSAAWKSSKVMPGYFFNAASKPLRRPMAATLLRMPPRATMPPLPPMASKSSVATASPTAWPSSDICATQ
ncbi:hypothetical protein D3C76_1774040 [compost metagenome]